MTNEELIKFLQDRIVYLEEMNRKLMERERPITPLPYPLPTTQPIWPSPSTPYGPINNNCPKCGLKLEGVMGYVCSQPQCPTGLGGVWCGTQTNT